MVEARGADLGFRANPGNQWMSPNKCFITVHGNGRRMDRRRTNGRYQEYGLHVSMQVRSMYSMQDSYSSTAPGSEGGYAYARPVRTE